MECTKCLEDKDISEFYKRNDRKKLYTSWCKKCICETSRAWSKDNRDKKLKHCYTYRQNHPKRRKAHYLLQKYVKKGWIEKQPCEKCGELKVEAHHPDYEKPLDVMWLCPIHHKELHNK